MAKREIISQTPLISIFSHKTFAVARLTPIREPHAIISRQKIATQQVRVYADTLYKVGNVTDGTVVQILAKNILRT